MARPISNPISIQKRKIREWEYKNLVYGLGYVDKSKGMGKSLSDNMQRRGYEAMRVSPSITNKFGLRYRKVYGASIEPNYSEQERSEVLS